MTVENKLIWDLNGDMNTQALNKLALLVTVIAFGLVPTFSRGDSLSDSFAEPCLVPVFHTEFKFPEGGGKIISIGDDMYFVRTYLPQCQNSGGGYPVIKGSNTAVVTPSTVPYNAPAAGTGQSARPNCY
jgi:hypothetical protein